uniref:Chemokine interleukin-8-like domain-containing protein n=1 Tax=Hucho hucho TaxID=62062 RepID=A0A4W5KW58_9TELE
MAIPVLLQGLIPLCTPGPLHRATTTHPAMRFSVLFFLILACLCVTLAQGSYEDCCLKYVTRVKKTAERMVTSYRRQETDGGCNIHAIVFTMKRGRLFCANPTEKWVNELMLKVETKKSKKHTRRPKRQRG